MNMQSKRRWNNLSAVEHGWYVCQFIQFSTIEAVLSIARVFMRKTTTKPKTHLHNCLFVCCECVCFSSFHELLQFSWSHDFKLDLFLVFCFVFPFFLSKSSIARKLAWKVPRTAEQLMIFLNALVRVVLMGACKTPLSQNARILQPLWIPQMSHNRSHSLTVIEFHSWPRWECLLFVFGLSAFVWLCARIRHLVMRVEQIYLLRFSFVPHQPRTM